MLCAAGTIQPTFVGYVATFYDALVLFEACLQQRLSIVPRRLSDCERSILITSGAVFIYNATNARINRWTDGLTWSPSRILDQFLVYRELEQPFAPRAKRRTAKKRDRSHASHEPPYMQSNNRNDRKTTRPRHFSMELMVSEAIEKQMGGSLVDSYLFKADGLVKKTCSITVRGAVYRLVSYYHVPDVLSGALRTPTGTDIIRSVRPRLELFSGLNLTCAAKTDHHLTQPVSHGTSDVSKSVHHENTSSCTCPKTERMFSGAVDRVPFPPIGELCVSGFDTNLQSMGDGFSHALHGRAANY